MEKSRKLAKNFLIALIITIVGFLIFGRITAFRILSLSFSTFYVISLKYFELSKSVKILLVIPVVLIFVVLRYYLGDRFLSYITYMILISFAKVYQE
jgi:voltage-gated potassium channel Kch